MYLINKKIHEKKTNRFRTTELEKKTGDLAIRRIYQKI